MLKVNNLHGFNVRGGGAVTSLSAVNSYVNHITSGTSTSVNISGDVQAGDLIVAFTFTYNNDSLVTSDLPSGFTNIAVQNTPVSGGFGGSSSTRLSYKIATGSETTVVSSGGGGERKGLIVILFRGDAPITSVTAGGVDQDFEKGNTDIAAQVVSAASGTPPLIVLGSYHTQATGYTISPRTFTPAKDDEVQEDGSAFDDAWLAYRIYNSSPANTTVDTGNGAGTSTATYLMQSCYLACA